MSGTQSNLSSGFSDQGAPVGGHICFIYTDEAERRRVMSKYIETGLSCGEKVVYLADRPKDQIEAEAFLSEMRVSVPANLRPGQFILAEAESAYCPDGTFAPERRIEDWRSMYRQSLAEHFSQVRVTGETSWLRRPHPGQERWFEYEARLNTDLRDCPFTGVICQYDATKMDGEAMYNVLNVHPMMIVRGQIVHNPYFEPPDQFLARMK